MIFDKERSAGVPLAPILATAVKRHDVRAIFGDPAPFRLKGSDRQQWYMLWADNFTSADYVGFVDSDTVFSSVITKEDLFVDGKPKAIVIHGKPLLSFWKLTPNQTLFAIGKKEPFKGMSYFPVIIKTAHLKPMREHITRTVGTTDFDEAYKRIAMRGAYSQFNLMLTYLWYFHRDEYFWDITEQEEGWTGPIPAGQIEALEEAGLTKEMLLKGRPRSSIHGHYDGVVPFKTEDRYSSILKAGYCYHQIALSAEISSFCSTVNATEPNKFEWIFEGTDYSHRSHVMAAHKARQDRIKNECRIDFDWDLNATRLLVSDFRLHRILITNPIDRSGTI
jgi:hypothetical protein